MTNTSQAFKEKVEALSDLMLTRLAIRLREVYATREARRQEVLDEVNAAKAAHTNPTERDHDED